ncbi:GCN5 family acetyltransferase [Bacillus sp. FJAT-18017]|uniref:GNAT family N-acetyltransferase n=1 Tax=Bacillus sp. FJAT-18017 TaxID=1705566 RepID=UPI0006ADF69A|nr:GNAT family N-acetyltransferase [Bacillus sp. FJAT-18017]ALC89359.1 GCN5 family acetyltransferase [Bacillus sp. FJAT-18017]
METIEVIEITEENLDDQGCFCLRSKPNSQGYKNKNSWLMGRFDEGLKYIKIMENGKQAGFIEYTPIEYSSRVVFGENYLVIHCLWVSVTGKGYASKLIQTCLQDAKQQNKAGVIVITNPDTSWTPSKEIFVKNGFEEIGRAPYGFGLLVHKLHPSPDPFFPNDWEERLGRFNDLTIIRTQQCPFVDIATENIVTGAARLGISTTIIDIKTREELMAFSPTPFGVYGVVYKNNLIAYHRLTVHSVIKRLKALI